MGSNNEQVLKLVGKFVAAAQQNDSWSEVQASKELAILFATTNYVSCQLLPNNYIQELTARIDDLVCSLSEPSLSRTTLVNLLAQNKIFVGDTTAARAMQSIVNENSFLNFKAIRVSNR